MVNRVKTRFAPSPTGFLHIGGARTALFNWALAQKWGGSFLLRIEDTDRERSSEQAVAAILEGLQWLGLDWDGAVISQFDNAPRHAEIAQQLLAQGKAYYCYCTPEELDAMRTEAKAQGRPMVYDRTWRDKSPDEAPEGRQPVIRIKAPSTGKLNITDAVQGNVTIEAQSLDDFVILRADGTPTYMLAVVVDDHDMGITHIVRGDDHLNNAVRQTILYTALDWDMPVWAHIPLIHGSDGAKLSKRHGAVGVLEYRNRGYLADGLLNYLARLGWSHGDDEIFSRTQFVEWFGLEAINKGASRLDFAKLDHVNAHHMQQLKACDLYDLLADFEPFVSNDQAHAHFKANKKTYLAALEYAKSRAANLVQLVEQISYVSAQRPVPQSQQTLAKLDEAAQEHVRALYQEFEKSTGWDADIIKDIITAYIENAGVKMGAVAQPLRAALCGTLPSASLFDVMAILGQQECLLRLGDIQKSNN